MGPFNKHYLALNPDSMLPEVKPKRFIVPYWAKALFFWFACLLLVSLTGFQIHKRRLYKRLYAYNIMRPEMIIEGQMAPKLQLQKADEGSPITWDYFRNKWVLLHFWATWCPPCRDEMPSLEWLHREMGDKLVVLTASEDEDWADVNGFFRGQKPHMILGWDKHKLTAKAFKAEKYPESFLISPQGEIIAQFSGPRDWSSAEAMQYLSEIVNK